MNERWNSSQDPRKEGLVTADKIVQAAFMLGRDMNWEDICRELKVRDKTALVKAVGAHGVSATQKPAGMRKIEIWLSSMRFQDLASQARQAGYETITGATEFLSRAAKDRVIYDFLKRRI